jgi:hypothetical protein
MSKANSAAARRLIDDGIPTVMAAFNLAGCRNWRFPPDIEERAKDLIFDLVRLFDDNEERIRPGDHARIEAAAAAQTDAQFQRFLGRLTE